MVLPLEFVHWLDELPNRHPRPAAARSVVAAPRPTHDLAVLLALLQRHEVVPVRERWLSLVHLRELAGQLQPTETLKGVRSELQTTRLRFLHYVADSLNLVALTGPFLKPTPSALNWLNQPSPTQWLEMWRAWLDPTAVNTDRWRRYRLPASELPQPHAVVERTLRRLAKQAVQQPFSAGDLPLDLEPGSGEPELAWHLEESGGLAELVEQLLAVPLYSLGVVTHAGTAGERSWCITPPGAWLLGQDGAAAPPDRAVHLHLNADLSLDIPFDARPAALLALADWTVASADGRSLQLTAASLAQAMTSMADAHLLAWSMPSSTLPTEGDPDPLEGLYAALARWARPLLNDDQRATMRRWLADVPSGRLGQHLPAQQGYGTLADRAAWHVNEMAPSTRQWLTTGLLLLDILARRLAVAPSPPSSIIDDLVRHQDAAELAAAEAAVARIILALDRALGGPAPGDLAMDVDVVRSLVLEAIAGQADTELRYWTARRGEVTHRRITPQRLTWIGEHECLVGYCHLRQAERHFRLDRVLHVARAE
jgi:hypothetical protein